MRIRDLGVIEEAVLSFASGLTVITGETGAGKTMVVHGLGLLLGARADGGRVRPGAGRAVVEGRFLAAPDGPAVRRALAAGAVLDDGALLITRTVTAEGRSRAYAGGTSVPAGVLGQLGAELAAVHGQSDQLRLRRPAEQRAVLDAYAGAPVLAPLGRYVARYARLAEVRATLAEVSGRARDRAREADLLRYGLTEVSRAAPQPGEDTELAATVERLAHSDALRIAATGGHALLAGELAGELAGDGQPVSDALSLLAAARRLLDQPAAHDPALAGLAARVADAGYQLADVSADLASYASSLDADPAALAAAQQRQAVLAGLTRKYAPDVRGVLEWAERAAERLASLTDDDERIERLSSEQGAVERELSTLAAELSAARRAAADRFARAVAQELAGLAMPQARVLAEVRQPDLPDDRSDAGRRPAFGPYGVDDVAVLLAPHVGAPARPLHRGASGGELSRVMLAVEVVLAVADEHDRPVSTFVFDEVDAGVGGRAAVEVGRRLARLAAGTQVIVVTHLPQVAAYADRHLVVEKSSDGRITRAGVRALEGTGRVRELSRMLAGQEDSALARGHAQELLASAGRTETDSER